MGALPLKDDNGIQQYRTLVNTYIYAVIKSTACCDSTPSIHVRSSALGNSGSHFALRRCQLRLCC